MSYTKDPIPRSDMTPDQKRRIGALQAAKAVLYGTGYNPQPTVVVGELMRVATYIETGAP